MKAQDNVHTLRMRIPKRTLSWHSRVHDRLVQAGLNVEVRVEDGGSRSRSRSRLALALAGPVSGLTPANPGWQATLPTTANLEAGVDLGVELRLVGDPVHSDRTSMSATYCLAFDDVPLNDLVAALAAFRAGKLSVRVQLFECDRGGPTRLAAESNVEIDPSHRSASIERALEEAATLTGRFFATPPSATGLWWSPGRVEDRRSSVLRVAVDRALAPALATAQRLLFDEEWAIGWTRQRRESIGVEPHVETWITGSAEWSFVADPFAFSTSRSSYLVFEAYETRTGLGRIVTIDLDAPGSPIVRALDPPHHLSYPFVFAVDGVTYLIPETHEARAVVLYRVHDSPLRFERVATLLEGVPACDTTVFSWEGRYWLFATRADQGANTRLYAWYADDLLGPWTPHAMQPLKADVSSSRPAGAVFRRGDALIRPAQDCSSTYGRRVVLNRIDELTPTTFSEHVVGTVGPLIKTPYGDGLHTLNALSPELTLLDAKRRFLLIRRPTRLYRRVRRVVSRLVRA